MLGLILQVIEDLVVIKAGRDAWRSLCNKAGLPDVLDTKFAYDDDRFYALVIAGAAALSLPLEVLVEAVGYHFVVYVLRSEEHARLFSLVGTSLADILQNINNFHGHLKVAYATQGLTPPVFRCSSIKETSLRLHYTPGRKSRHSLAPLIVGIVKALAELVVKNIENLSIVMEKPTGKEQAQFLISWTKAESDGSDTATSHSLDERDRDAVYGLSGPALNRAFPFHILLNSDAEIIQFGTSISKIIPLEEGERLSTYFTCLYPANVNLGRASTFDGKERDPFVLEYSTEDGVSVCFKGQVLKYRFKKQRCVAFLGSPIIQTIDEMVYHGLGISDFAVHDPTKDVIFASPLSADLQGQTELAEQIAQEKKRQVDIESRAAPLKKLNFIARMRRNKSSDPSLSHSVESNPVSPPPPQGANKPKSPRPVGQTPASHKSAPPSRAVSPSFEMSPTQMQEIGAAVGARAASACPMHNKGLSRTTSGSQVPPSSIPATPRAPGTNTRSAHALQEVLLRDALYRFPLSFRVLRSILHDESSVEVYFAMVAFHNSHRKLGYLLHHAMAVETAHATDPAVFLREDNMASKLVAAALRLFNQSWLQSFMSTVLEVIDTVASVDELATPSAPKVREVLKALSQSAPQWSAGARFVISVIDNVTSSRLPGARRHALVNAIFLRLLCPCIAIPVKYRLVFGLNTKQQEYCRALSRTLQALANQITNADSPSQSAEFLEDRKHLDCFFAQLVATDSEREVGPFATNSWLASQMQHSSELSVLRDAIATATPELLAHEDTRPLVAELFQALLCAADTDH